MGASVDLCGRLRVEWDGERLEDALAGRQSRLLFAYLVLHRDRPVRRDELIEALWADAAPADGDALLRPLLSRLRRALGDGRVEGRAELALRFPDDTVVDVEVVRAGTTATDLGAARAALAIADRGLLPGLEASWIDAARAELDELRVELLEAVARAGARLGPAEQAEAERAARRAVELSPFRESARAALIEVLRRRGNTAEALVAYEEVRALLREELGSAPGPALRAAHERLLVGEAAGTPSGLRDRLAQAVAAGPWVDRGDVLERLRAAAREAADGATALLVVTGQGGIGKTRLIAELAASLDGFDVLYGRCDEEQLFSYGPWVQALRSRLGGMDKAERAELLGASVSDLARLLPELAAGEPPPPDGDPGTERRRLFAAVTTVLARLAARRPLLVVIDDLHWADRSSLLLSRHVAGEADLGRVLLVGTFRDTELDPGHPLPGLIADLERHRPVPRVLMTGMDDAQVGALIGTGMEASAVRAIREETDGNPFFVKQLVRHLEETGGALDDLAVPQGVRDVIARRVSRLPAEAGRVLRVAALIGRDFDFDLLAEVATVPDDELLDVLDAAVRGALLVEVGPGRYSFAHALLRSSLESELSRTRRALLHRRIGEVLEARHGERLDELARHFAEAGPSEAGRAVAYGVRAAEEAARRLAHDEAVRLLRRALAVSAGDPDELGRLHSALAAAESAAGHWEAARASFRRAADLARTAGDAGAFAQAALGHTGSTWEAYGRADPASVELLEEALERLDPADSALRGQLLGRLAMILYFGGAPEDRVMDLAFDAVAMARRMADDDALAAALVAAMFALWRPGRSADRLAVADELVPLEERRGLPVPTAEAHAWRSFALLELCRLDEAEVHVRRHAELVERIQHPILLSQRDSLRSTLASLAGDFDAAKAAADAVLVRAQREEALGTPEPNHLGFYGGLMFTMMGARGELGTVLPVLEELTGLYDRLPGWSAAIAWAHVQAGDTGRGRAEVEALMAGDLAVFPRDANFVPAVNLLAHAVHELGAADLAPPLAAVLAPHRDEWSFYGIGAGTLGPYAYSLGLLELVMGRRDAARATLERARTMRSRPFVALTQAALARAGG